MKKKRILTISLPLALALVLLLVLQVLAVDVADFEIDGNTEQDGSAEDWETVILDESNPPDDDDLYDDGPATLIQDGSSAPKAVIDELNIFAKGGKFGDPAGWTIEPGNVPAQNDLTNIYVYPTTTVDSTFMIMGMHRIKKQGTFDLDFEYNQQVWNGTSGTLVRTEGDVVVGFELSGNPTDPQTDLEILVLIYEPSDPTCASWDGVYGAGFCIVFSGTGDEIALSNYGAATMNGVAFDQPPWGAFDSDGSLLGEGEKVEPFFFAEAAIDLGALGIETGCPGFGSVHAKSRSSLEVTADLKDLAQPISLNIDCFIEGYKWHDLDADGVWDTGDGESGLAGWEIQLLDITGTVVATTTTDANGYYMFKVGADGEYEVREVCPASGWFQSYPGNNPAATCGANTHTGIVIDVDNRSASNVNFGNYQNGTKSGYKFHDLDADGCWDDGTAGDSCGDGGAEPGLNGWTIEVWDATMTSMLFSTTTANDGSSNPGYYEFSLAPGSYVVAENCSGQGTWYQSYPGTNPAACGSSNYPITLVSGEVDSGNNFGNYQNATKSGYKFHDLDADGCWDDGTAGDACGEGAAESGLDGWTIQVYDDSNALVASTTTGDDGNGNSGFYSFSLTPGSYEVKEDCTGQTGTWYQSFPGPNGAACGANSYDITLTSGQADTDNDFGNYQNATKSGYKFHDLDADGCWDDGTAGDSCGDGAAEPGLNGWTIEVWDATMTSVLFSTTTGDDGSSNPGYYEFSLTPGSYVVAEDCSGQGTWYQSYPGTNPAASCGGNKYMITLTSGEVDNDNDFGNYQNATKSGYKFYDLDADGCWDDGTGTDACGDGGAESGIGNWTIEAWSGGAFVYSTTTAVDGYYEFDLTPGSYTIMEVCPDGEGWIQSYPSPTNGCGSGVHAVTLTSGENHPDNNFGNYQEAVISGVKYKDADADGSRGAGEPGMSGWTIKLYEDADNSGDLSTGDALYASMATDGDGAYSFTILPGSYIVCEVAQSKWAQTDPDPVVNSVCEEDTVDPSLASAGYALTIVGGQTAANSDFGNTPLSDIDLNFYDLTGFTDASIVCYVGEGTSGSTVGGTVTPGGDAEISYEANGVLIGTYTCVFTIIDP